MRRQALPLLVLVFCLGCAAGGYTPLQQAKLQAKAYTSVYASLYSTVVDLEADRAIPAKVHRVLIHQVNPALNSLKELILAYDKAVKEAEETGSDKAIWQAALYKVRIEKILAQILPVIDAISGDKRWTR